MSKVLPILACLLLVKLAAGAAPPAPTAEERGATCAHACPCDAPSTATGHEADGQDGDPRCPANRSDDPCPAGCNDCPCCPGGLVAMTQQATILPPVHDRREALSGPPELRAAGTTDRLFIPPKDALV